jgi:ribulose-phosphate 3-epimerase
MQLYPAILTDSIKEAQSQILEIASVLSVRTVQIDVIDGLFVDNVTITPLDLKEIDFGELSLDIHLITEEPLDYVYEAISCNTINYEEEMRSNSQTNNQNSSQNTTQSLLPIRSIHGQVEKMSKQLDFLQTVRSQNWLAGLSLDLHTPLQEISPEVWPTLDSVQLMGIDTGFQGQKFNEIVFQKIKELQKICIDQDKSIQIVVDGGVTKEVIPSLQELGVHAVAVGSNLWNTSNVRETAETFFR